jgi:uncharacterized DUF497 family protein
VITYDPKKDKTNKRKHGISLSRAEDFDFEEAFYSIDNREDYGEVQLRAIGLLDTKLYTLVFADEEEGDNMRAISLRKAIKHEAREYKESR